MTPNGTWTLNSQMYLRTLNAYPRGPNFGPFRSTISVFHKIAENRKCTEWPQTELEHLTVKSSVYTLNTYPRGPNFAPFRSTIKIQGCRKSETHRMTPTWTWTLNSQKYSVYTKYLPMRRKFCSVSLFDQRFQRYHTSYNSQLTPMLNIRKRKKMPKIQKLKLHNSLHNFGRDPP